MNGGYIFNDVFNKTIHCNYNKRVGNNNIANGKYTFNDGFFNVKTR